MCMGMDGLAYFMSMLSMVADEKKLVIFVR